MTIGAITVNYAPTLTGLPPSACQATRTGRENTVKNSKIVIATQLANDRSDRSIFCCAIRTLFRASRQTIEALARCGLCISFTPLTNLLPDLVSHCMDRAIRISRRPHVLCYGGINISTSVFEQRPDTPTEIQSDTFQTAYEIANANSEDMRLAPMLLRVKQAAGSDIGFNRNIRPTFEQIGGQLRVHVAKVLLDGDSAFYNYPQHSDPLL